MSKTTLFLSIEGVIRFAMHRDIVGTCHASIVIYASLDSKI